MNIFITAPRSELGGAVTQALRATGAKTGRRVLLNLSSQPPNNLLHDGHRWKRYTPGKLVRDTELALAEAHGRRVDLLVHASFGFLAAIESGAVPGDKLAPLVDAALEAERMVLAGSRPACVLRLGYLYGPGFEDLKAYRLAFRLGRPYWAGPSRNHQLHLHIDDAAAALLLAAQAPPSQDISYVCDDRPASFRSFMDHFARLVGNPLPQHLPRISRVFSHLVVAEEHMQMVDIAVRGNPSPRLPGFRPRYKDYKEGLAQVIEAWKD